MTDVMIIDLLIIAIVLCVVSANLVYLVESKRFDSFFMKLANKIFGE